MSGHVVSDPDERGTRVAVPHLRTRDWYPTLRQAGIAAHHYPRYVNEQVAPHDIDVVLLTFVRAGRGRHLIGPATYDIRAPSVAVTLTGQPHSLVSEGGHLDVVNVLLDTEAHPLPALEPPLSAALATLIPLTSAPGAATADLAQLSLSADDRHDPLLELLVDETIHHRSTDLIRALRTALLATLAHAMLDRGLLHDRSGSPSEQAVLAVRDWLDQHYLERHTLADLASRAHLERTYFSHRFSQVVGMPVTEYLARLRVRYAAGLLQTTELPVSRVATTSGFTDLSHFGRTFRRLVGASPRRYREDGARSDADGP